MSIGFIGAGNMAQAIIGATIEAEVCAPWEICACDKSAAVRELIAAEFEVAVSESALEVTKECKCLFLAVKPQDLEGVLREIAPKLTKQHLLISIAAGKSLATLRRAVGEKPRLLRVMPNLALKAQEGMSVFCGDESVKRKDKQLVMTIFGAAGAVLELPERHFDAVTALSGSGPAFVAYFLQSLEWAALALELPAAEARLMVEQTVIGAAVYLQQSGVEYESFIKAVSSPGGTTEAGMKVLVASGMEGILAATLQAARDTSKKLR